jgi:hypothetical protein
MSRTTGIPLEIGYSPKGGVVCGSVAQRVDSDVLAQVGCVSGLNADPVHGPVGDVAARDLSRKKPIARSRNSPVVTEEVEQSGREHHVAIFASLALADMDHHALAVDVLDTQSHDFRKPEAGSIGGHENDTVLDADDGSKEPSHLVEAEDGGQLLWLLGATDAYHNPFAVESDFVEELQGGNGLVVVAPGDVPFLDEEEQIGTDLLSAQRLGGSTEVECERGHSRDVDRDRPGGEVAEFHVLDHSLA